MKRIDEQIAARQKKRSSLEDAGIEVYPARAPRTASLSDLRHEIDRESEKRTTISVVGRIRSIRSHGGSTFLTMTDEEGEMQILLKKDELGEGEYERWTKNMDIGDFFTFSGTFFRTKKGELTLSASRAAIVAKALRPIPETYFGLKDRETLLRKRYLDLLLNEKTRMLFRQKAVFWQTIRAFLVREGFLEVETPVLESIPGGADAKPFSTTYTALEEERFLRISLELPLKRLLVGGFEKVFEIGRIFRNEGISAEHLQDYTQCEFYWAYADYRDLMKMTTKLFLEVVQQLHGTHTVDARGRAIDFSLPWKRYDYFTVFQEHTSLDLHTATLEELRTKAKALKCVLTGKEGRGRYIDLLFKMLVRPTLQEPGFLVDPPVDIEPLAKRLPNDPQRVQRFQIMAWGTELGKGFSELNDPVDQRKRFREQMELRAAGDDEAQRIDDDYLEAMEYGMPPAAGFGMSERLFAFLVDKHVRETVLFPPVRTENNENT
ncbi:MAG: lysine--tRNA ligase [bacterium]